MYSGLARQDKILSLYFVETNWLTPTTTVQNNQLKALFQDYPDQRQMYHLILLIFINFIIFVIFFRFHKFKKITITITMKFPYGSVILRPSFACLSSLFKLFGWNSCSTKKYKLFYFKFDNIIFDPSGTKNRYNTCYLMKTVIFFTVTQ